MAALDMSLDDMIKTRRSSNRGRGQGGRPQRGGGRGLGRSFGGGGGGGGRGGRIAGAFRRVPLGLNARPSSFTIAKSFRRSKTLPWQRDLFEESLRAAGIPGIESGAELHVSNLDVGVTNEDIRELFSEMGELKRYAIHYGKTGRPSGSAEVVYVRRSDAFKALQRYNNVQLDGKPMKIEIVGTKSNIPVSARFNVVPGVPGRRMVVMGQGVGRGSRGSAAAVNRLSGQGVGRGSRGSAAVNRLSGQRNPGGGMMNGRGSGAGSGERGRGRGRGGRGGGGRKKNVDKSADELDKELENYHATAMES